MVGSRNVDKYKDISDKNGEKVGRWSIQLGPGVACCKFCPNTSINFSKGKLALIQHSETKKHLTNSADKVDNQPGIKEALALTTEEDKEETSKKARDLEITLVQMLSRHCVPAVVAECITALMKKYITDSNIVQKIQLGASKVSTQSMDLPSCTRRKRSRR